MSEASVGVRRQIRSAEGLKSVVRTMKTLAAVSIGPFEKALQSLEDYVRIVDTGLKAFFRSSDMLIFRLATEDLPGGIGAVVFGSDLGLVGPFNEHLARFAAGELGKFSREVMIWPVGERLFDKLADYRFPLAGIYPVPESIESIPALLSRILLDLDEQRVKGKISKIFLFYNRPAFGTGFEPVCETLLPLDRGWLQGLKEAPWPTRMFPELWDGPRETFEALIREYLFVSMFKACARSGASEQATRLAAMQRAEKNINELLDDLRRVFHQSRQNAIMEELFDVIAGFEVLRRSD